MTLRIGICDDSVEDIKIIQKYLDTYNIAYDVNLTVDSFSSGSELLNCHKKQHYDIILLDIEMPSQNGMEIAQTVRAEQNDNTLIIFTTSYPQYMQDSFEVQPFQFLTKPINYSMIEKLLTNIIQRYQKSYTTKILISNDGEEHLVHINDILFMQAMKNKQSILKYVFATKTLIAQGTIQKWETTLSDYGFISPCRGYLVNIRYIHSFNQTRIQLTNGLKIPISRRRVKLVKQAYANRIVRIMN